jgi:hypothetical protein
MHRTSEIQRAALASPVTFVVFSPRREFLAR